MLQYYSLFNCFLAMKTKHTNILLYTKLAKSSDYNMRVVDFYVEVKNIHMILTLLCIFLSTAHKPTDRPNNGML